MRAVRSDRFPENSQVFVQKEALHLGCTFPRQCLDLLLRKDSLHLVDQIHQNHRDREGAQGAGPGNGLGKAPPRVVSSLEDAPERAERNLPGLILAGGQRVLRERHRCKTVTEDAERFGQGIPFARKREIPVSVGITAMGAEEVDAGS